MQGRAGLRAVRMWTHRSKAGGQRNRRAELGNKRVPRHLLRHGRITAASRSMCGSALRRHVAGGLVAPSPKKYFSVCLSRYWRARVSAMLRRFSLISMVWCLSQPAQASFDTFCQIFLPSSPGSGGKSRPSASFVQLDAVDHAGHGDSLEFCAVRLSGRAAGAGAAGGVPCVGGAIVAKRGRPGAHAPRAQRLQCVFRASSAAPWTCAASCTACACLPAGRPRWRARSRA